MTIELRNVSRWYGNVVAVNDVTMSIGPGVTGLLGPNGAGKSTIMHMIAGFLPPSRGELTVAGGHSWHNPDIYRTVALVPERDSVYAFLTGEQFVVATAKLHQLADPAAAATKAIALLDMADAADRRIGTYSKGMRQRIKVAAALVHDPEILLLDEPFNGMDPRQRLHMMDLLDKLGSEGRTILFSSHILEEVERLSGTIQVVVAGRLAASGDFRAIRRLMTSRPHVFTVRSSDDRLLGGTLIARPAVTAVELTGPPNAGLVVRTSEYGAFCRDIAILARDHGIRLREVQPTDESLESVFAYLVADLRSSMSGLFNPTVARITIRATLGRRRALLFALPAVILIVVTLALKASHPPSRPWPSHVLGTFGFSVLLPLTALIIGCSVLGAEIDDGSVIHLLATPVRRSSVIVTKFAVATVLTVIFAAVPELIAALISGGGNSEPIITAHPNGPPTIIPGAVINHTDFAVGLFVGALVGAVIYNAIFIMVSAATTRAIAVGLLYVLVWEALLANFVTGARLLSVSHYALGIANGIAHDSSLNAGLSVATSIVMGTIVTVLALVLAVNLLSSFTLKGEPA